MSRTLVHTAFALAFGAVAVTAHAATLNSGDVLTISPGVLVLDSEGDPIDEPWGSWFGCDCSGNGILSYSEKYPPLSQGTTGIVIGVATLPGASHWGFPVPGDTNAIDAPYDFFGNTGSDFTSIGITGSTEGGLNMSGWGWAWNGTIAAMGSGAWGPGFSDGVGNFVWDGVYGHAYTLDYRARVPAGHASGFGGVGFAWHFEGTVAVPEATTYAMMLVGLGLVGAAARRRRLR